MSNSSLAPRRPVILIILDGVGLNPSRTNNAVALAHTPRLDGFMEHHPHTVLEASGRACGLPDGQMGNSEVGHLTLGCGELHRQDLVRIDDAITDGSFFDVPALIAAAQKSAKNNRPLHLLGLVSDGGVHSHINHLLALIKLAKDQGARPLLHMFTDGRDTAPKSAISYLSDVEAALSEAGGAIVTICGRYYAMDRDQRWERTFKSWDAIVHGEGQKADSAQAAIQASYDSGVNDEFIQPIVLPGYERPQKEDGVIFFNFRNDRPRQLAEALGQKSFTGFERFEFDPLVVASLTEYDPRFRRSDQAPRWVRLSVRPATSSSIAQKPKNMLMSPSSSMAARSSLTRAKIG